MYLKVKMENDLLGFIDREVIKFVENSTGSAIQKLTQAQRKLTDAQRAVNRWEKEIKIMRAYVAKDQAKDRAKIEKAQRDVTNAQRKVNSLNKEIKKLKAELKRKNKPYHAPERAYIRTKLAGLYTAKATAWTALEGYKKIVLGLMKKFNTNPDADARVIALKANKNTALGTLEAAKIFMEGLKKTLGFTGDVATFVIDKGTDALINVRSAEFEGRLGALSGGAVKMKMKLEWMGKTKDVSLDFDFDSPAETVKALAKKLMDK
jgi:predicted RNase H-like nuclease (RuvC/YqgF family)